MTANSVVNQIFQSESFVLQKGLNCPKSTIQGVGTPDGLFLYKTHDSMRWYTRKPFPVPNPRFKALVHQTAFSCTKSTIQCSWYTRKPFPVPTPRFKAIGTPDGLSLYKLHDSRRLVHQTAFPCTNPRLKAVGTPESLSLYQTHDSRRWYTSVFP